MPDVMSLDNDVLSFTPGNPMLTAESSAPAPPAPPARDYGSDIAQNRAASDAEIAKVKEAQAAQIGAMQGQAKAQQPFIDKALAQTQQSLPARPKQEKPPAVPQRQSSHEDEQWLFASALLGSLAGALTRRHQTNALAAFSGALDGYNEGSKQKFDQSMRVWEAENKRALETNKQAMDEYRDILEDRKLSTEQMFTAIKLAGLKNQDQAAIEVAKQQNGELLAKYYDKRADAAEKAEEAANKLTEKREESERRQQTQLALAQMRALGVLPGQANEYAEGIASYDIKPPTGVRGAAIMNLVRQINPSYDDKEYAKRLIEKKIPAQAEMAGATTRARVLNSAGAQTEITLSRAGPVLTNAAEAANRVPATEFKRLNQLYQMAAEEISDPAVRNFKLANEELAGLLAAVNNPRSAVITVSAYEHARELIIAADGPDAYQEVLQNIARLANRENESIENLRRGGAPGPINIPPISPERRASFQGMVGKTATRADEALTGAAGPEAAAAYEKLHPRQPISNPEAAWDAVHPHLPEWLTLPDLPGWLTRKVSP